jgi:hypothetical protein
MKQSVPPQLNVSVVSSFDDVPSDFVRQWRFTGEKDFSRSYEWFKVLAATALTSEKGTRIYLVRDGRGNAIAALPCVVERKRRHLGGLTTFYSIHFSVFLCADNVAESGAAVTRAIRDACESLASFISAERPRWSTVDMRFLLAESAARAALEAAFRNRGWVIEKFFQYENWIAPTAELSFSEYFAQRPSQLRNTIRRRERKLRQKHSVRVAVVRADTDTELDARIREFVSVYNRSWKRPEPFPDFIPALCRAAAKAGALRLGLLYVDERPVAAQLWLTSRERALIYKLAYDEDYKEWSVGSILSKELFRVAIDDDRVHEIDYGVGSEPYKRDWMTSVRSIVGLIAINPYTWRGLALVIRHVMVRWVRRWRGAVVK